MIHLQLMHLQGQTTANTGRGRHTRGRPCTVEVVVADAVIQLRVKGTEVIIHVN